MISGTAGPAPGALVEPAAIDPATLAQHYGYVRTFSEFLCEPLHVEDYVIQSMPDASPTKWHLAHTTWFFETFVLKPLRGYESFNTKFDVLFNSYYNAVGKQFPRPKRGLLSRPTVREILDYRHYVDTSMVRWIENADPEDDAAALRIVSLGLHHEQQHQELILTDIKHVFSVSPLHPIYRYAVPVEADPTELSWRAYDETIAWIGHDGSAFAYDNEMPRHRVLVHPFELGSRLVTNCEYIAFMDDGGYERPEHWLSEGWAFCQEHQLKAPAYWHLVDGQWRQFTLSGLLPVRGNDPVCHVSYYEADAFARWAGARLPTEFEWELASQDEPLQGNFVEMLRYHPLPDLEQGGGVHQLFGDVWEWTQSPYVAYPGYHPAPGALGEYNGKFMCNQFVLRGGSCATSISHMRPTYRNFFPAPARWQFTGIRLARNV